MFKKSEAHAFKTFSKKVIQKTEEVTGDLIGSKIADKITRSSKTSQQNNFEANEEILTENIYPRN